MKKLLVIVVALGWQAAALAADLGPGDFRWQAAVDAAPHAGLVRAALPADALLRLQSRDARDLRLFDAQGRPVPFAMATPALPPQQARAAAAPVPALPLHAAQAGQAPPHGSVQVRIEQGSGAVQTVWVQAGAPDAARPAAPVQVLPAALFDTRALREPVAALRVQATLPDNVPVAVTASTSTDLAQWQDVPVRGRLFRFGGSGAPANHELEFAVPLALEGRYLRLDWRGHDGITVASVQPLLPARQPPLPRPAATLPAPQLESATAREWQLDFATPIAQLELVTDRPNTLLPLRILGRNQVSEPWRQLAQTVVYRLGVPGQESSSGPVPLPGASVRWLRVEATHGVQLAGVPLSARVMFDPVEIVFAAGAGAPYQLAAGRQPPPAAVALPLNMLAATSATRVEALPLARVTATRSDPVAPAPAWARWLPRGLDLRTAGLWAVLLLGVMVLGGVAWRLLRQADRDR